jgi:hypothetical protein
LDLFIACLPRAERAVLLENAELRMLEPPRELAVVGQQHQSGGIAIQQADGIPALPRLIRGPQRKRDEVEHGAASGAAAGRGDDALGFVQQQVGRHQAIRFANS